MTKRSDARRLWDDPRLAWLLLGLGGAIFVGMFVLRAALPGDVSGQDERAASIETQAVAAQAAQAEAVEAEAARRAERMN